MKNLDIKRMNLKEMDTLEMKEINGGVILETLLGIAIGWLLGRLLKKL